MNIVNLQVLKTPLLFKKVAKKVRAESLQKFTSLDGNQANSSHQWVCQGFPAQKPSISASNVLPKSLEKVLGKDLFLDLLRLMVVFHGDESPW